MPKTHIEIESVDKTVSRKVVHDVAQGMISLLGLHKDTKIKYPGKQNEEDLPVSLKDRMGNSGDPRRRAMITVEEQFLNEEVPKTVYSVKENPPIFRDPKLGVTMTPVYARSQLTINFRFHLTDTNSANNIISDIRYYANQFRDMMIHEAHYDYLIPRGMTAILEKIHELRENQDGYGQNYFDYINEHATDQITVQATRDGQHIRLSKEEVQTAILGDFEYFVTPDAPNRQETETWLDVEYVVNYDKPISMLMEYPIIIHNQPLPKDYYDHHVEWELGKRGIGLSKTQERLNSFTNNGMVTKPINGMPIPHFNEWQPAYKPPHISGAARVMLIISPNDKTYLMDLQDLGGMEFEPDVVDYLKSEGSNILHPYMSAIYVCFYDDDELIDPETLNVDELLNVSSNIEKNLRNNYHAFIGVVTDLTMLDSSAMSRLVRHGSVFNKIIQAIDYRYGTTLPLPNLVNNRVSKLDAQEISTKVKTKRVPIKGEGSAGSLTVNSILITADREE